MKLRRTSLIWALVISPPKVSSKLKFLPGGAWALTFLQKMRRKRLGAAEAARHGTAHGASWPPVAGDEWLLDRMIATKQAFAAQ